MAAAAAPYVTWLSATGDQAQQAAAQAAAAAGAYETAYAATVPPPLIAANRSLLAALVATNILGQNTPAIMSTEALYAEMWAQDAAAMYGYAGASATASQVTPFTTPPQTTNPGGLAGQLAAAAQSAGTSGGTDVETLMSSGPQLDLQHTAGPAKPLVAADSERPGVHGDRHIIVLVVVDRRCSTNSARRCGWRRCR